MGKINDIGLLPPDHPMFTGRVETFSKRKARIDMINYPKSKKPLLSRFKTYKEYREALEVYQGKLDSWNHAMSHFRRGAPRGESK